jgi:hypothetical protein
VDKPDGGRVPIASPTIVYCLPAVGMNAHGVAQGSVRSRRPTTAWGPRVLVAELPRGARP